VDVRSWRREHPALITSAADPRHVDIRRRESQYLVWMAIRVLCFVLAVLLFHSWARFAAIVVALVVPWVAVVVANGGPAPSRRRPAGYEDRARADETALLLEPGRHTVVDGDASDGGSAAAAGDPTGEAGGRREGMDDDHPRQGGSPVASPGRHAGPGATDRSDDPPPAGGRAPFAPAYTPPPPRGDVGFFGPRRPARRGRGR
jgi:hypothetical protein